MSPPNYGRQSHPQQAAAGPAFIPPQIYEDLGAMRAMISAATSRLEAGNVEFRLLRDEQGAMMLKVAALVEAGVHRTEAVAALQQTVDGIDKRVDDLVRLRHQASGALFLLSAVGGTLSLAVYALWSVIKAYLPALLK